MATCASPFGLGPIVNVRDEIVNRFEEFNDLVLDYTSAANEFTQILANFSVDQLPQQQIEWDVNATFTPFALPADPEAFEAPDRRFSGEAPDRPRDRDISTAALDRLTAPNVVPPTAPPIAIPSAPVLSFPSLEATLPTIDNVEIPVYVGEPLPEVPTLYELNLPDMPDIDFDEYTLERPDFIPPSVGLQDNYRTNIGELEAILHAHILDPVYASTHAAGVRDWFDRAFGTGGTGVHPVVERMLFERAYDREELSSARAMAEAQRAFAARGFELPGATLLANVREAEHRNRLEKGRLNRDLTVRVHELEVENIKFAVTNAIALEGQLIAQHTQIFELAKAMADGQWLVAKGIYDNAIDLYRLQLQIYTADIDAYKSRMQIVLAELDAYRTQLEGQRIIGSLNEQLVAIYRAELEGVLANVEIFKAQVQGAEAQIRAQLSGVELYRAQVQGYTAELESLNTRVAVYDSQIKAEETKTRLYSAQVDAFGKRIDAFQTQVSAEATKIDAQTRVVESDTRVYSAQVEAWRAGLAADNESLRAAVEVYRGQLQAYEALLNREQYRVTGESRNFELELTRERARVEQELKQVDQAIEQLKHVSNVSLAATDGAARVNAQLAASAMSAISVSASMSSSDGRSASDSRSCSTNYSGLLS